MDKKVLIRRVIIMVLVGLVPVIISKMVACIMIHKIILPIQEAMSELANQYQAVSQEAMSAAAYRSIQNFLLDTGLQFNSYGIAFTVLFIYVVSTMICSIINEIVCEYQLRHLCIDELSAFCSEEDIRATDTAETIIAGIAAFLCVCLMLYSELSAFL